jgi:hypothetical protein
VKIYFCQLPHRLKSVCRTCHFLEGQSFSGAVKYVDFVALIFNAADDGPHGHIEIDASLAAGFPK